MGKPLEGLKVIEVRAGNPGTLRRIVSRRTRRRQSFKIENKETGDLSRWMLAQLIGGPDVKNAAGLPLFPLR